MKAKTGNKRYFNASKLVTRVRLPSLAQIEGSAIPFEIKANTNWKYYLLPKTVISSDSPSISLYVANIVVLPGFFAVAKPSSNTSTTV